jgi:hypothetical protein
MDKGNIICTHRHPYIHSYTYLAIEENEIMSFAGKGIELEIIMLSEISQVKRANSTCSHSFLKPRPKIMMTIVMVGHEYIWGTA